MSQQGSALDGHLERCQRFAATGQLSSGCVAEVAAAARPLLQAVEGALAELSKLLHLLLMHCGKLVIMMLLLLGTQLSSKAVTVLCCLMSEHWVSVALAEAGFAQDVDQDQMELLHHTVHLLNHACIGGCRPHMLDHTQHQQPDFQEVQALAAVANAALLSARAMLSVKSSLCYFSAGMNRFWYS